MRCDSHPGALARRAAARPQQRTRGSASQGRRRGRRHDGGRQGSAPEADRACRKPGVGGTGERSARRTRTGLPLEDLPTPTVDLPPSASSRRPCRGTCTQLDPRRVEARRRAEERADSGGGRGHRACRSRQAPTRQESVAETETADPAGPLLCLRKVAASGPSWWRGPQRRTPGGSGEAAGASRTPADAEPRSPPGGRRRGRVGIVPDWNGVGDVRSRRAPARRLPSASPERARIEVRAEGRPADRAAA